MDPSLLPPDIASLLSENRRQKALLDSIFKADPSGLAVVVGPELRIAYANPAYRFITPNPFLDPIDQPYERVWPADSGSWYPDKIRRVLETGQPFQVIGLQPEIGVERSRFFTLQARRIEWDDQLAALIILWDITDLKQAESLIQQLNRDLAQRNVDLEAERQRWKGVVEGIADEVWTCDERGRMSVVNLANIVPMGIEELKGKTLEEILAEVDILTPDGLPRPAEDAPLLRSLRTGENVQGEEIISHRATGKVCHRQYSSAPLREMDGTLSGAVSIVRDVTANRLMEAALRESDARSRGLAALLNRYRLLFEQTRDILLFVRVGDGRILEANQAAERAYGYSREELLARTISDLRAPQTQAQIDKQMVQANSAGILFETLHHRRDGSIFPVEVSSLGADIEGQRVNLSVIRDISERIQAEEKLGEAYARAESLARFPDENPNPVARAGRDGRVLYHNAAAGEPSGWGCADGQPLREPLARMVGDAIASGGVTEAEVELGGRLYSISIVPCGPCDEEPYANLYGRDVTELRLSEQRTAAEQEWFRTTLASIGDAVITTNSEGQVSFLNAVAEELTGWRLSDAAGLPADQVLRLVDEGMGSLEASPVEQVLHTGRVTSLSANSALLSKTGEIIPIEDSAAPIRAADGQVLGVVIVFHNIAERRTVEQALIEHKERLEAVIDTMRETVILFDPQGNLIRINPAGLALYGFANQAEVDQAFKQELIETYSPKGLLIPAEETPLKQAARGEWVVNTECHIRRKDTGRQWTAIYNAHPIRDSRGETQMILVTAVDLTFLRQTQQEFLRANAWLDVQHRLFNQREEERKKIARDLHDGPLQELIALNFSLHDLGERSTDPEQRKEIQAIKDALQRQVSELRDFAMALRPPILEKMGLESAVRSHLETFQPRNPNLAVVLDDSLAGLRLPEDKTVPLFRVFQEALNNIVKHAQASRVTVRAREENHRAILEIEDDGVGFVVPADWVSLAYEGHLGLVGMRERMEAAGGQLKITSQPGQGTLLQAIVPVEK